MSRLYNKYLELKKEDSNIYYLFRSGNFYKWKFLYIFM